MQDNTEEDNQSTMCVVKAVEMKRPIRDRAGLLKVEVLTKLLMDEKYLRVLAGHSRSELSVSKSYYYYILQKLRRWGLLEGDSMSSRFFVAFSYTSKAMKLLDVGVGSFNGLLIFVDCTNSSSCSKCSVIQECVSNLKSVNFELRLKFDSPNPAKAWSKILQHLADQVGGSYLLRSEGTQAPAAKFHRIQVNGLRTPAKD